MPLAVMRRVTEVYVTTILVGVVVDNDDDDRDRCWILLMIMRRKIEFFSEISELWTSSFFVFFFWFSPSLFWMAEGRDQVSFLSLKKVFEHFSTACMCRQVLVTVRGL